MTDPTPVTTLVVAKMERQSCGRFFFDCPEPSVSTLDGILCRTCGVTVTGQYFNPPVKEKSDA